MGKLNVLFVCVDNAARSQMAEAFLRAHASDSHEAFSAGLRPASQLDPLAVAVMQERGLDLSGHRAKRWQELRDGRRFDYLITVCRRAERQCPTFAGMGKHLAWPFEDPAAFKGSAEERLARYRQLRDAIEAFVRVWLRSSQTGTQS